MKPKKIYFNNEARTRLKRGIDILANSVKVTLGPKGRNVVIDGEYVAPHITKDGVTVAEEIILPDTVENMGAMMIKEVASKTAYIAGDGTTTATVLAQAIINSGLKHVEAGSNPIDLKKGIDKAVSVVVKAISEMSVRIDDDIKKIEQVATISSNNDTFIGKLISSAFEKVGKDSVITVEEAKGTETEVKIVDGLRFNRGYISPYFINNNEKFRAELDNPYILLYDKKITSVKEILPILNMVNQVNGELLIIAEDVEGDALAALILNKVKGVIKVAAVRAPNFGERRRDMMQDIAILTGGTYITSDSGQVLQSVDIKHLGRAKKVIVEREITTIIEGYGDKNEVEERKILIKSQIENARTEYEKNKLHDRLAQLCGSVAILYVGATTEIEMKEKKDRVDDALHATTAAIEEGIVPGGGVCYIRCVEKLTGLRGDNEDEDFGINIVKRALEEPLRQIAFNAGFEGSIIVQKVKEGQGDYGFNARTEKFENLYETGVIDPAKVVRVALENAASIASLFLTTECVIAQIEREDLDDDGSNDDKKD